MILLHDPACADYGTPLHPEQPARVVRSASHLKERHPSWEWRKPGSAEEAAILLAHTPAHLERLRQPVDFDADTAFYPGIEDHARRSAAAALEAAAIAAEGRRAFSLMRPPGHHATADRAMGFCYLNQVAIAGLDRRSRGASRVAVWDFDAHHGNGTEAILQGREDFLYVSVHQYPGYPGTGAVSFGNSRNFPVAPMSSRWDHMAALKTSWEAVLKFQPDALLVSAGFDAYAGDPITQMTLEAEDFHSLGIWLREANLPTAAVLEGGYSQELPVLIDAFLTGWAT